MQYPDFKFVDSAVGSKSNRNNVIDINELQNKTPNGVEAYATWQRFTEDYLKYYENNQNSVSGYSGPSYADFIPFDFDDKEHPARAQENAINFVRFLENYFEISLDNLQIFFSGWKGFHVLIPIGFFGNVKPSVNFHFICKKIAYELWNNIDFSIYEKNRLLRVENSKHPESGLYKIRLDPSELYYKQIDEIKFLARNPRILEYAE